MGDCVPSLVYKTSLYNAFLLGFGGPDRAGLNAGRLCASRRRLAMAGIALVEIRLLQLA